MDWTGIITTLIATLVPTGGIVAIVTLTEKKSELMLKNAEELAGAYKELAEEYKQREASSHETLMQREAYYQGIISQKEQEVTSQVKMNSSMRHQLDDAHTEMAVAKLMYCEKRNCMERKPPFGSNVDAIVKSVKDGDYTAKKREDRQNG